MRHASHSVRNYQCAICQDTFERTNNGQGRRIYCDPCYGLKSAAQNTAYKAVNQAIRTGKLPKPWTQKCVDCGKNARLFDHRRYDKPLEVSAVCDSCNQRRGPASFFLPKRFDLGHPLTSFSDAPDCAAATLMGGP
jgi:hypothetical protein